MIVMGYNSKIKQTVLAGVAQLIGHFPTSQKVACWNPSQRTCMVGVHEEGNQSMFLSQIDVSLSFSLPSPLSKSNKIKNISLGCCGSVDWVPTCEPKGCWFNTQSRAHAWVVGQVPSRGCARGNHTLMFFSSCLPPSLPLSKNKQNLF